MSPSSSSHKKDKVTEALSNLSNLTLDTSKSNKRTSKPKTKAAVADSWEDDDESGSENELKPSVVSPTVPSAPPPTPFAANYASIPGWDDTATCAIDSPHEADPTKRPEKTDAVARRMIAAGLGMKAPKQTEEQKAYQKSIREQERKRKEQEREEEHRKKQEAEKAKAAVWDD